MTTRYRVKKIGLVCACLMLAGAMYALVSGCFSPADFISYHKFLGKVQEKMSGKGKAPYCAEQRRQGVSREVWFRKGPDLLKAFLTAEEAEIAYEGIGTELEIIEHLIGVKGWVQEKLYTLEGQPMQSVYYFEAESALYRNSKQEIDTDQVQIAAYHLPDHELDISSPHEQPLTMSIYARALLIRLFDKQAVFTEPKGVFYFNPSGEERETLEFSAGRMIWDEVNGQGSLNDNIMAVLPNKNMILTSDKQLVLKKEKHGIRYINSYGKTVLSSTSADQDITFECSGEVSIDCAQHLVTMQSAPRGEQLIYKDNLGKIFADNAQLKYQEIENKLTPLNVDFEGNVSVTNRQPPILRQVLADKLNYSFLTHEIDFDSKSKRKVLFYDQANNLKMSAKGLTIHKDNITKKESIKGRGQVRLRFDEQEFARLKKRFLLESDDE